MDFQEIIVKLKEKNINVRALALNDFDNPIEGIGEINEINQQGGEGEGESWHVIKFIPDHNMYIKIVGFYQSDYGVEFYDGWECAKEVRPVKKSITVYE